CEALAQHLLRRIDVSCMNVAIALKELVTPLGRDLVTRLATRELPLFEQVFLCQPVGNMAQTVLRYRDSLWPRVLRALQYCLFPIVHCRHPPPVTGGQDFNAGREFSIRRLEPKSVLRFNRARRARQPPSLCAASSGSDLAFRPPDPVVYPMPMPTPPAPAPHQEHEHLP